MLRLHVGTRWLTSASTTSTSTSSTGPLASSGATKSSPRTRTAVSSTTLTSTQPTPGSPWRSLWKRVSWNRSVCPTSTPCRLPISWKRERLCLPLIREYIFQNNYIPFPEVGTYLFLSEIPIIAFFLFFLFFPFSPFFSLILFYYSSFLFFDFFISSWVIFFSQRNVSKNICLPENI